jgi:methylated-DNA-[protein]-cysteine S-methyltransferase
MTSDRGPAVVRPVESPLGVLVLGATRRGLISIEIGESTPDQLVVEQPASDSLTSDQHRDGAVEARRILDRAEVQLGEYFAGDRIGFDLPIAMAGTDFQLAAWTALGTIAYGETISYAEQARRMGRPGAARAVGSANGRNPIPIIIPCHRVIGADGSLTGYTGGLWIKKFLLDHEQVARSSPSGSSAVAT